MSLWLSLSPILLASAGAILGLAFDAFDRRGLAIGVVSAGLLAAGVVSGWLAIVYSPTLINVTNMAVGRGYSAISAVVFLIAAITLVGGSKVLADASTGGQVAVLTALLAAASSLMASTLDLLIVIIALEAIAMISYALVSARRQRRSDEAAMKYFIQGAVATGFALYALSIIFGLFSGSVFLPEIAKSLTGAGRPALVAMALLMGMYAFKLSAFPFHSWAPDAYETATPSVTAFMGTAPKLAILASLMLVFPMIGFSAEEFATSGFFLFALLATASIVFGNFTGLKQTSFTRMLAYSGIAQVGYALVGAAAAFLLPQRTGFAVLVAGLAYAVAAAGAFMGAQAVRSAMPTWDGTVAGLAGVGRKRPALSAALTVMMLSLTGIPLTAGFWGKFLAFGDAATAGHAWLAAVGLLGSVVSFGYYGGVIRSMYLEEPSVVETDSAPAGATPDMKAEWATIVLAVCVLAIGVLPFFYGLSFLSSVLALF
ncbi:MAG: NADH-quinone oxidoreductase subunit N [Actinomycetia bacterium]|nr:NADH-quinone oxidoreductase subunit N [Actinomycetes bacterium]